MSKEKKSSIDEEDAFTKHLQISIQTASLGIDKNIGTITGMTGSVYAQPAYIPLTTKNFDSLSSVIITGSQSNTNLYSTAKNESTTGKYSAYQIDPITIDTNATFKLSGKYSALQGIDSFSTNLHITNGIMEVAGSAYIEPKYESKDYFHNILGNTKIINGAFTIDSSNLLASSKIYTSTNANDVWYVKNGSLVESPTQRLISGSIDHLGLTSSNKLHFDTSIIEQSSASPSILGITNTTQNILAGTEWNKIGTSYNFNLLEQIKIKDSFLEVSSKYMDLYTPAKGSVAAHSIPNTLRELTSLEYLNNSILLRSTYEPEIKEAKENISVKLDTNEVLLRYLSSLKPDLKNLYIGALEALNSKNPDKIRHYTTSFRELFTHVLHLLAPDNQIKEWTKDENHYVEGKPTRKARILYISRKYNSNKFEKFVECDVKSTIEFLNLFQEGTHSIVSSTTKSQLAIMKTKMETTLIYLIESSKIN